MKSGERFGFLLCLGGMAALICACIVCVPFLLNTPFVKGQIVGFIQEKTGVSIPAQGMFLDLSMTHGRPCLVTQFQDMEIPLSSAGKTYIGAFQTQWDIEALFRGKAACPAIQVQDVRIELFPVKDASPSNLSFLQSFLQYPALVFSFFSDDQETLEILFDRVSCPFFSSASGVCSIYRDNDSVAWKSHIRNILVQKDQAAVKEFLPQGMPIDTFRAGSCDLNIQAELSGNEVSIKTVLKNVSVDSSRLKQPLTCASGLTLVFSRQPGTFDLHLAPVQWDFPRGRVGYSWTYDEKKQPCWNMVFSGQNIIVDEAASVSLALGKENQIVRELFAILQGGNADQVEVAFSGNTLEELFAPDTMTLSGKVDNARVQIPATPLVLTKVQGKAAMKKGKLMVKASSGACGNTRLGACDVEIDLVHSKDFPFHGKFSLDADMAQLPRVFSTLLPKTAIAREMKQISRASGRVQGVLFLDSPSGKPLDIRVDARHIAGTIDYIPFGRPLTIHKGSILYSHEKISFENMFADMGQNAVRKLSGQVGFSLPHVTEISSGTARLDAAEAAAILQSFALLPPNIFTRIQGKVTLERIFLKGPFLEPGQWKYQVAGQGKELDWEFAPDAPWSFGNPGPETLSGRFDLTNDQLYWQGETGYQVRGKIKNTDHGIQIRLDQLDLCDFVSKGNALFVPKPGGAGIEFSMHIQSIEQTSISSVFACLLKDGSMVEGPCSFSCDLRYKGLVKDVRKNLKGEMKFSSFNGTIHRATFLARILSVINIFNMQDVIKKGFEYHSINIKAVIENGKIRLTHAVIDASSMVLLFTGWIDPFAETLELACLVAPLKTVDTIIGQIPLVNVIIGKKLLSIPVGIQGSLQHPDIMILNPSKMGNNLLRLFEHVITAPARLFDMKKKNPGAGF